MQADLWDVTFFFKFLLIIKELIMGGAGHMLHAIKSLKQNRAQLKNHRSKNKKGSDYSSTSTKVEFKQVSAEELEAIKQEIQAKAKKSKRRELIIAGIVGLALLLFVVWLNSA